MKRFCSVIFLFLVFLFAGCAYQENLNKFDSLYYGQKQQEAFEFSKKKSKNNLLWQIQSGVSGYVSGNYKDSLSLLDAAEELLNKNQAQGILSSSLSNTGATLINDNVKSYQGNLYEGVMINYYKALDALLLNDDARARVEFNRANDRQRRAKDYYQKEIKKAIQAQEKDGKTKNPKTSKEIEKNTSKDKIDSILNSKYSNLKRFAVYEGFINPLVTYMSGLYFSLQGDPKGIDLLKEAYGTNHSKIIAEDILLFQKHQYMPKKYTWIIVEDGRSALKQEFSFNIPLYLVSNQVLYFGLALPQLQDGVDFYPSFDMKIKTGTKNFEEISLFDGIIANEFSKQLPFIVTRAVISAVYKASMQSVLNDTLGTFAGIGGALFSAATTAADTRITTVFPHRVWLNRVQNNEEKIIVDGNGKKIFEAQLIECKTKQEPSVEPIKKSKSKQEEEYKVCKNTNNIIYIRTTKNNIIPKLIVGEKQ